MVCVDTRSQQDSGRERNYKSTSIKHQEYVVILRYVLQTIPQQFTGRQREQNRIAITSDAVDPTLNYASAVSGWRSAPLLLITLAEHRNDGFAGIDFGNVAQMFLT